MIILDVEGKCKGFFEKNRKKLKGGSRSGIISNIWASILSKNGGYRVSMIKIKDYVRVGSLEEAYELNQKRSACILGGMLWTKTVSYTHLDVYKRQKKCRPAPSWYRSRAVTVIRST